MQEPDMDYSERGHEALMRRLTKVLMAVEQTDDEDLEHRLQLRADELKRELNRRAEEREGPDFVEPGEELWPEGTDGGLDLENWR